MKNRNKVIGIIGLGYVGLPLSIEFARKYQTIGFDIDAERIAELSSFIDKTREIDTNDLKELTSIEFKSRGLGLSLTTDINELRRCNIYIITVPTPIDKFKAPNLIPLLNATKTVAKILSKNDIVIYESTVFPGCTEEECVPILEKYSQMKYNREFYCGYSPERINPGDKVNTLKKIVKVTSGSTPEIANIVDSLYQSIIDAGTFKAANIKVAEASKAIENAQRDLNISFMNELALIFERMNIDTSDVIEAASTKWNFLKFRPGLVGGHCIGVDPYYLAHKAESLGYYPQVILSGRRVNDMIGEFIANKVVKLLIAKKQRVDNCNALILGITFKENCPDIRNTKVVDIYKELLQFGIKVDVYDPHADHTQVYKEFCLTLIDKIDKKYDLVILAVAHLEFLDIDYKEIVFGNNSVIYDTKSFLCKSLVDGRL